LNKPKHKASSIVLLPEPLCPIIKVVISPVRLISVGVLPDDKKLR
jgi:hypothetical protein